MSKFRFVQFVQTVLSVRVFRSVLLASSIFVVSLAVAGCNSSFEMHSDSDSGVSINSSTKNGSGSVDKSSWSGPNGTMNSIIKETRTTNGKTTRSSTRNINGVESKLEAPGEVVFLKGKPSKWTADAKVIFSEKRNGILKEGELRPDGTQMKVWIKRGNKFEAGSAEDQAWADKVVSEFNLDDTPEPEKKKEATRYRLDDPQFVQKLASLHYAKDKAALLTEKAQAPSLSAKEQVALIDIVLEKVHYEKDQKAILLALIHRKDLTKEACTHLLDGLDKIHDQEDRKVIQRELFERASKH